MTPDTEALAWLIRKDGYFYRPNRSGYTTSKFEAGRYTEQEARREAAIEPWHMKAVHQDEWPDDAPSRCLAERDATIRSLTAKIAEQAKEIEDQRECKDHARKCCDEAERILAKRDAELARARSALEDLLSWFPEKPSEPQWQIKAGAHGADDAVAAARKFLEDTDG